MVSVPGKSSTSNQVVIKSATKANVVSAATQIEMAGLGLARAAPAMLQTQHLVVQLLPRETRRPTRTSSRFPSRTRTFWRRSANCRLSGLPLPALSIDPTAG